MSFRRSVPRAKRMKMEIVPRRRVSRIGNYRNVNFQGEYNIVKKYWPKVNRRTGGFIDFENKFQFTNYDGAMSTTWQTQEDATADTISAVLQGDTETTRDGRVYHITSVHVRGYVYLNNAEGVSTATDQAIARVLLVLDTQTNGAQLSGVQVMSTNATPDVLGFRNLQYTKRFRVIMDKQVVVRPINVFEGSTGFYTLARTYAPFQFNWRPKVPLKVTCSGTTAVVGSIQDNSLHIMGAATNTGTRIQYSSRMRFKG